MKDLQFRSNQLELLDASNIPFDDIKVTLQELNIINQFLGGHAISQKAVDRILKNNSHQLPEPIIICEIGCGGGDNLAFLNRQLKNGSFRFRFIGIDLKPECILYAQEQYPDFDCQWIASDYRKVQFQVQPHIIFSSLFCHHFTDPELIEQLIWKQDNAQYGFFINDLQRHWLAYYLIKILCAAFSRSYLVRNDAPVSVSRGFKSIELKKLFRAANIKDYSIEWQWAFRYLALSEK